MKSKLCIFFFLIFTCNYLYAQVNLNQGLVAYYPFNGNANDVSGNNINGVVSNATLTTDKFGASNSAYDFNGTSSYIQLPYSNLYNFAPQDSFSISVLVLPDPLYTWPAPAVVVKSPPNANYNASNWNYGTYIFNQKAMAGYAFNNVVNGTTVFGNNPCWYNIIQTYKNGVWKLYVNGVLESQDLSQTKFILQDGSSSKIAFGKKGESFGDWYKGKMDEVRIYNKVLNQAEVNALSTCVTNSCNNWLSTPNFSSNANIGNLNVTGNKITVEATFNCTSLNGSFWGHLIAKHIDPSNVCYALAPNGAEISTSNNGYVFVNQTCPIELNKTYHTALVYDGATLKFYRNGFLMSQAPCTGNISTNSLLTTFGNGPTFPPTSQFKGYINEVRIWNVARTQAQLQTFMNSSLPNPTTQVGLLGYYTFDNLLNKQGNTAFNGTLNGGATINATNPNCTFVADSCNIIVTQPLNCKPTYQKMYGGNKSDIGYSLVSNNDGTTVIAGATNSFGNGGNDGFVQKLDINGNLIWSKVIGGAGNDAFYVIKNTLDGGYVLVGNTTSYGGSSNGIAWMVKIDANGNTLWTKKYDDGSTNGSVFWDVIATSDGGYALSGTTNYAPNSANAMIIKTDNLGNSTWAKSFDSNNTDQSFGILEDNGALIISALQYGQSLSFYDGVIMKLNIISGAVVWAKSYEIENKSNWFLKIFKTNSGYSVNVWDDINFSGTVSEQVILNTDFNGTVLSAKKATLNPIARVGPYLPTSDNGYIFTQSENNNNADINVVKIGSTGSVQWTKKISNLGSQTASQIVNTNDGGFAFIGTNNSTPALADSNKIYIIKTDSLGNTPGCNLGSANATITNTTFTETPNFIWNSITNIIFSVTTITSTNLTATPIKRILCDSCNQIIAATSSTIINDYTPALALDICTNKLTVENAIKFNVGDTVLLIQMKGAVIDSTNTAAFGNITDYKSAGNYEFNYVKSKTGNVIELKNKILRTYEVPNGKVQLIRVPYFTNYVVTDTLTCLPWDGSKGGVLVFNVQNNLTLNNVIDVSGKGFRGGRSLNQFNTSLTCFINNFSYPNGTINAAEKGESIYSIGLNNGSGKGKTANGGGGGNGHNSGGGGGSNGGNGGFGGYQLRDCNGTIFDNRGFGGIALTLNNTANKIFMGGGGGSGHTDNNQGINMNGGNGGGIIIISANQLINNSNSISSNGFNGQSCNNALNNCHDGNGGGGAGGTNLLLINNYTNPVTINEKGGKGADLVIFNGINANQVGPGGGGSGGLTWFNQATIPINTNTSIVGGANGVIIQDSNNPWGATAGNNGLNLFNLVMPITNIAFKPNIDSVRFTSLATSCSNFNFNGLAYTNSSPIATWQWNFGDATSATGQNTSHNYSTSGTFIVKLIVTDINGCKDSISKNINTTGTLLIDAGADTAYCSNTAITRMLQGSTNIAGTYAWTPSTLLNNSTILNPTANISSTTKFYLTVTTAAGCTALDSVIIRINALPNVVSIIDTAICKNINLVLTTSGASTYIWTPATAVNNATIASPLFIGNTSQQVTVIGTDINGCKNSDIVNITVKPLPNVITIPDTLICSNQLITLTTSGAQTYSWSPSVGLSNPNIANPIFSSTQASNTYYVTGTASNGCTAKDTLNINVRLRNPFIAPSNVSLCKNETVTLNGNNGTTGIDYVWTPNLFLNNPTIINPITSTPVNQVYNVQVRDIFCAYTNNFMVNVTVNPLPVVRATKSNDVSCDSLTAKLLATGASNYIWSPTTYLTNATIYNPISSPPASIQYSVIGTDINGCKNKDSVQINVASLGNAYIIPNGFTPNGDGKNDTWFAFGQSLCFQAVRCSVYVYNRYGSKVYESENYNNTWDGTYKGKPLPDGTYYAIIVFQKADGSNFKTRRDVTILR